MHGNIDGPIQQRLLDFLGEQPLVADLFQRAIRINQGAIIARGLDHDNLERGIGQIKGCHQTGARLVGLRKGKR